MGESTEQHNAKLGITREEQDAFGAAQPPARRARRRRTALFAEEIAPVTIPQRKGDPIVVAEDEGVRPDTTAESLASCARRSPRTARSPPARPRRSPTAPRAVVVMSKAKAEELGLTWLAEIGAHGNVAGPDNSLHASRPTRSCTR